MREPEKQILSVVGHVAIWQVVQLAILILKPLRFLRQGSDEEIHASEVESRKNRDRDNHDGVGNCEIV
jgi:hypothetical protein